MSGIEASIFMQPEKDNAITDKMLNNKTLLILFNFYVLNSDGYYSCLTFNFLPYCRVVLSSLYSTVSTTLSSHCSQRPGGLAQWRLPLLLRVGTTFQIHTSFSRGALPPLRQTASWLLCILSLCQVALF
jgi:hypothetical protein